MIKWILIILCCSFFGGCLRTESHPIDNLNLPYISPELRPFVDEFILDMDSNHIPITRISNLDSIIIVPDDMLICGDTWESVDEAIGCSSGFRVQIKREREDFPETNTYLRFMVYHELGHAILNLPHDNSCLQIMNSSIDPYITEYDKYWPSLHQQFIGEYWWCLSTNCFDKL